jgi:NAD(P)-dependent dehydrogenase (short-subunit alcohol dehydrogenase family)
MAMAKTWFITGASRGFGALIAEEALRRGDNVVATARDPATVISRLGEPESLLALALDVTNEMQARAAADTAVQRFKRIDILLNNAGFGLLGWSRRRRPRRSRGSTGPMCSGCSCADGSRYADLEHAMKAAGKAGSLELVVVTSRHATDMIANAPMTPRPKVH